MSQKKKPFGLNAKAERQYFPKTPKEKSHSQIKLTPMSGVKNSLIPNILESSDVEWKHRKQRSVTPPRSRSPSLPVPTKSDVNMLGFTPSQMYNILCIILGIFSLLCLAAADTVQSQTSNSNNSSVLYFISALSACIVVLLLFMKFCR